MCIIDACRDSPGLSKDRSTTGGLAQTKAPAGSLLAYATAPGTTASDGAGENGLYTKHENMHRNFFKIRACGHTRAAIFP